MQRVDRGHPPYIICGSGPHGPERATRVQAASALVLALKWADLGYQDIETRDSRGGTLIVDHAHRQPRIAYAS